MKNYRYVIDGTSARISSELSQAQTSQHLLQLSILGKFPPYSLYSKAS
jgi:hypothetical protein